MSPSRFLLVLACLTVATVDAAVEDDPLISDRPDFTESATPVSPGRIQFEMGYTRLVAGDTKITTLGEMLVRFGVAENTEGRVWFGSYAWFKNEFENHDGLSDLHLGVKHRFVENDGLVPETALLASVTLPTGAKGTSSEELQPVFVGAFSWDLSSAFSLGANLGWSHLYNPRDRDRFSTWWGSLALGVSLGSRLGAFVETFAFNREDIDGNATSYLDVGLTFLIHENLQLDGRVGQGFNGLDEDWFTGIGLVSRI